MKKIILVTLILGISFTSIAETIYHSKDETFMSDVKVRKSLSQGKHSVASGENSIALGSQANATNDNSFVFNGDAEETEYSSNGDGTFNINTPNGIEDIYIGTNNLKTVINDNETDPTVHDWAKAANKPSYSYSEITGTENVSHFTNDAEYVSTNNLNSVAFSGSYGDLTGVPTKVSQFTNDTGYLTSYTETDPLWSENSVNVLSHLSDNNFTTPLKTKLEDTVVNNNTIAIQTNGTTIDSFTLNQNSDKSINIHIPTNNNELTNGANYITGSQVPSNETDPTVNNKTITIKTNNETIGSFTLNQATDGSINIHIPTNNNELSNGAGYLTSYTETDPTVKNGELVIKTNNEVAVTFSANSANNVTNNITIPTVNNATLKIQKNGTDVATFTANASSPSTANIEVPTVLTNLSDVSFSDTIQNKQAIIYKDGSWTNADVELPDGTITYVQDITNGWTAVTDGSRLPEYTVGPYSLAIGSDLIANGTNSVAIGRSNKPYEDRYTEASGNNSVAIGLVAIASGNNSHAEGGFATASGTYSFAVGDTVTAGPGEATIVLGSHSEATNHHSIAIGEENISYGTNSLALGGRYNEALADYSVAMGDHARTRDNATNAFAAGRYTDAKDAYSYVWSGKASENTTNSQGIITKTNRYLSHGYGTFNIDPKDGVDGVYIGDSKLSDLISGGGNFVPFIEDKDNNYTALTFGYRNEDEVIGKSSILIGTNTAASGDYSMTQVHVYEEGPKTATINADANTNLFTCSLEDATKLYESSRRFDAPNFIIYDGKTFMITNAVNKTNLYTSENLSTTPIVNGTVYKYFGGSLGIYTHSEGCETVAYGHGAHSEGIDCISIGAHAHSEGVGSIAYEANSHAEGYRSETHGDTSHAEGLESKTYGTSSHAEGFYTEAWGEGTHTEGYYTKTGSWAPGAHAEGYYSIANGDHSHVDGWRSLASNDFTYVWSGPFNTNNTTKLYYGDNGEGTFNINPTDGASGFYIGDKNLTEYLAGVESDIHLERYLLKTGGTISGTLLIDGLLSVQGFINSSGTLTVSNDLVNGENLSVVGSYIHAEGKGFKDDGYECYFVGNGMIGSGDDVYGTEDMLADYNVTIGDYIIYRGSEYKIIDFIPSDGDYYDIYVLGSFDYPSPVGETDTFGIKKGGAEGDYSHIEGLGTITTGNYSHAEGSFTRALGESSHSEGYMSEAHGENSHAEGEYTKAIGRASFTVGLNTIANGNYSEAHGSDSITTNDYSFVWNGDTQRSGQPYYSHGDGTFNINPFGGTEGFYIGEEKLSTLLASSGSSPTAEYTLTGNVDNDFTINVSGGQELYYSLNADTNDAEYTLTFQPATSSKFGKVKLYLTERYVSPNSHSQLYTIATDNIENYPVNEPWLTQSSANVAESVWEVEFKSVPGSTKWYYVDANEFVVRTTVQPSEVLAYYFQFESGTFPSYSGTSFNAYNSISSSDVAMNCLRLNKGNDANDKKVGTTALRMAPISGSNGYFYNTTAFTSPVTKLSFQYAKYGTGTDTCQSFVVSTSTDGSTWTELVDLTSNVTENLQTYTNDSTIPANTYYIKFENTSTISGNSRRLDIDEIQIWLAN